MILEDSNYSSTSKIMEKVLILTAVHMKNKSYNNISSEAIKNCFIKCHFSTDITNNETNGELINDLPPEGMNKEQFSIFVNFDNVLEESAEISDPQLHQNEIDENEPDEECTVKNIPSHIEINKCL